MKVRPPAPIYMIDGKSCTSCVTLQILYMFGFENPPFVLQEMDRRIGRAPGEYCLSGNHLLELLRHGINFTLIEDFDVERAVTSDGYSYMQQYLAQTNPGVLPLYTPEYFEMWQGMAIAYRQQMRQLPGKRETTVRSPAARDIPYLMQERGCPAVIVSLLGATEISCHMTIAYGITNANDVMLYNPLFPGESVFQVWTLQDIDSCLVHCDPLIGVSLSF